MPTNSSVMGRIRALSITATVLCAVGNAALGDDITGTVWHQGIERDYILHLPGDQAPSGAVPLVVVLHGGGFGDAQTVLERFGFNDLADQEGFAVVYPNGYEAQWNDGRTGTLPAQAGIDDVGFIDLMLDDLIGQYDFDTQRIYVTGASNGGMMSMRLGVELSHRFAGIASVIANMPVDLIDALDGAQPDYPMHTLMMMGTADPFVPYQGGEIAGGGPIFPGGGGQVISAEATRDLWLDYLDIVQVQPMTTTLPDLDPNDRSIVHVESYLTDAITPDMLFYELDGAGHSWPGGQSAEFLVGPTNYDIWATEEIWNFFESRPKLPVPEPSTIGLMMIAIPLLLRGNR